MKFTLRNENMYSLLIWYEIQRESLIATLPAEVARKVTARQAKAKPIKSLDSMITIG